MAVAVKVGAIAGEYMESVLVTGWFAQVGDPVRAGDLLLEIETAKAAIEVPCPADGVLNAIRVEAGEEVPVSTVLALIGIDADDLDEDATETPNTPTAPADGPAPTAPSTQSPPTPGTRVVASPWARRRAADLGVDLAGLAPSSPSGRLKARDVEAAANTARRKPAGPLSVVTLGQGTGVPLVLIHGFSADANGWRPLVKALPGRPALAIELPAHGGSPRKAPKDFAALVRQVVKTFDGLGLKRAHLVGHSLGAAVALALVDARAEALASLTLIAPGGLGPDMDHGIIDGILDAEAPDDLAPWLARMVGDPALIDDAYVVAAWSLRGDPKLRRAQADLDRRLFPQGRPGFDLRAELSRLDLPARIIWGRDDGLLPWSPAITPPGHVGLHLLAGVGHMPQLERPNGVARILAELMDATDKG